LGTVVTTYSQLVKNEVWRCADASVASSGEFGLVVLQLERRKVAVVYNENDYRLRSGKGAGQFLGRFGNQLSGVQKTEIYHSV
jgi:hypothetical protein